MILPKPARATEECFYFRAGQIGLDISEVGAGLLEAMERFAHKKPQHVKTIRVAVLEESLIPVLQKHVVPYYGKSFTKKSNLHTTQMMGVCLDMEITHRVITVFPN